MFKQMTLHQKLIASFITLGFLSSSLVIIGNLIAFNKLTEDAIPSLKALGDLTEVSADIRAETLEYLNTEEDESLESIQRHVAELDVLSAEFLALADDPGEGVVFADLVAETRAIIDLSDQLIQSHDESNAFLEDMETQEDITRDVLAQLHAVADAELAVHLENGHIDLIREDSLATKKLLHDFEVGYLSLLVETTQYFSTSEEDDLEEFEMAVASMETAKFGLSEVVDPSETGEEDFVKLLNEVSEMLERDGHKVITSRANILELLEEFEDAETQLAETVAIAESQVNHDIEEGVALSINTGLLVGVLVLILSVVFGLALSSNITRPIIHLATIVQQFGAGALGQRAIVETGGEIEILASNFNTMAASLETVMAKLASRTQALESSIEVSRRLATLLKQDELVAEVVEQIQSTFGYYHTHIYLLNEDGDTLMMAGGSGEAGRIMLERGRSIAVGVGVVGLVAQTNTPIVAADVAKDQNWFQNPLLPETKAEAAVPISVGDVVLGVLDVQQDTVHSIRDEDVRVLQSIANQVAIALRNVRLYTEAQEVADQQTRINEINQKIQQATTVERALQIAVREVGRYVESGQATVQLADFGVTTQPDDADMFNGNGHVSLEGAE